MKAHDHLQLTRKALEIFNEYSQDSFASSLLHCRAAVEKGAAKEDYWPIPTRITNWHFFKQNKYLCPATIYYAKFLPLRVTPTSEKILMRRVQELLQIFEKDIPRRCGHAIGRVLHHVQDMSSPPHVVPVYHGPLLKDSFEEYSCRHIGAELQSLRISRDEFASLLSENTVDILMIYRNAADRALRYLYNEPASRFIVRDGNEDLVMGWEMFWRRYGDGPEGCWRPPHKAISGFGCYGPLGGQFGDSTVKLSGRLCLIDPAVYKKLHRWVLREQVLDSLRTLLALSSSCRLLHICTDQ